MRTLEGVQYRMRIFIGGADTFGGRALYKTLVEMFRREKLAGATVLRGLLTAQETVVVGTGAATARQSPLRTAR